MAELLGIVAPIVGLLIVIGLTVWLVRSVRRDPRWIGNAYLGAVVVGLLVITVGMAGNIATVLVGVVVALGVLLSPLIIIGLIIFLICNGIWTVRREGLHLANGLALVLGVALAVAVVFFFFGLGRGQAWLAALAVWVFLMCAWVAFLLVCFLGYGAVYQLIVRRAQVDWVLVLGSGLRRDGTVTPLLAARVDRGLRVQAAELARGRRVPIVMSGGKGSDERRAEGVAMAEYAVQQGADPDLVVIEDRSTNTEENLRNSSELVRTRDRVPDEARGMIVSSNYHVMRAAVLARDLDLPLQATGAPVAFYYWPTASLREFVAVLQRNWVAHLLVAAAVTLPLPALVLVAAG